MNFNKTTKLVQGKPFDKGLNWVLAKYKLADNDVQPPKTLQVSNYLIFSNLISSFLHPPGSMANAMFVFFRNFCKILC